MHRPNVKPESLGDLDENRIAAWRQNRAAFESELAEGKWKSSKWRNEEVIGSLLAMQGETCAYCQGELSHSDLGDVEHFRPKSKYWWLAYTFKNYFLTCSRCNRTYKRSEFPIHGRKRRKLTPDLDLQSEKRLFIEPTEDPVKEWIVLKEESDLFFVEPSSKLGKNSLEARRVKKTIEILKLNELVEVVKDRTNAFFESIEVAEAIKAGDNGQKDRLIELTCRFAPHHFAARKAVRLVEKDLLPSKDDEDLWLMGKLTAKLKTVRAILNRDPNSKLAKGRKSRSLWALSVLYCETSAVVRQEIDNWIAASSFGAELKTKIDCVESSAAPK